MMMQICFANQEPDLAGPTIFLAGPTPRSSAVPSWRVDAIALAERLGFTGTLLVPERQDWSSSFEYYDQVEWEYTCLEGATIVLFWVPRDLTTLPGFTTNVEFGRYVGSGRCVYGRPEGAPNTRYLDWLYHKLTGAQPAITLEETLQQAIERTA
jgi:hypothetical protein